MFICTLILSMLQPSKGEMIVLLHFSLKVSYCLLNLCKHIGTSLGLVPYRPIILKYVDVACKKMVCYFTDNFG